MNTLGKDNEPAYLCCHVFERNRPILYVCRAEGDWQFLCGGEHPDHEIPHVVCLAHILEQDASIAELRNLPPYSDPK